MTFNDPTCDLRHSHSTVRLVVMSYDLDDLLPYLRMLAYSLEVCTFNGIWEATFWGERGELAKIAAFYRQVERDYPGDDNGYLCAAPLIETEFRLWSGQHFDAKTPPCGLPF